MMVTDVAKVFQVQRTMLTGVLSKSKAVMKILMSQTNLSIKQSRKSEFDDINQLSLHGSPILIAHNPPSVSLEIYCSLKQMSLSIYLTMRKMLVDLRLTDGNPVI